MCHINLRGDRGLLIRLDLWASLCADIHRETKHIQKYLQVFHLQDNPRIP